MDTFNILTITYLLNGLVMIALPVGLAVYLTRRFRLGWQLVFIGAATFILSQVGHIPFNNVVLGPLLEQNILPAVPFAWRDLAQAAALGLSAGVWEEVARFVAYRRWARDARTLGRGLVLGAGHGGVEAVILGVLVLVTYVYLLALRGADLTTLVPADQVAATQQGIDQYWSAPWPMSLLGAVERLFALPLHLACSLLVLQVFTRRRSFWLLLAIGWHALVDALAVYLVGLWGRLPPGAYYIEIALGVIALLSLGIIFALRRPEPQPAEPPPALIASFGPAVPDLPPMEESQENLDRTRFT